MKKVAIIAATLVAMAVASLVAQSEPFLGTWVLNVAKSKYTGPLPKSQTSVYEAAGQGVKVTTKGVNSDGTAIAVAYTANFDGAEGVVTGSPDYDSISLKKTDSHTLAFTRKKNGKVVQTGTIAVSHDGKTRTVTTDGVNGKGEKIHNVAVYDRKQATS